MAAIKFKCTIVKTDLEVFFHRSEKLKYQDRPAKKFVDYLVGETATQFDTQTDPDGKPWKKLKSSTLASKATDLIGTETRAMRRSLYGKLTKAGRGEIGFKVPYAPFFNKDRQLLGVNKQREDKGQEIFEDHLRAQLGDKSD